MPRRSRTRNSFRSRRCQRAKANCPLKRRTACSNPQDTMAANMISVSERPRKVTPRALQFRPKFRKIIDFSIENDDIVHRPRIASADDRSAKGPGLPGGGKQGQYRSRHQPIGRCRLDPDEQCSQPSGWRASARSCSLLEEDRSRNPVIPHISVKPFFCLRKLNPE